MNDDFRKLIADAKREIDELEQVRKDEFQKMYWDLLAFLAAVGPYSEEGKKIIENPITKEFVNQYMAIEYEDQMDRLGLPTDIGWSSKPYIPMLSVRNDIKPIIIKDIWL